MKVVLTIAGSDSGGGAGIQADLKTFNALGTFGTTAITCITAQNPSKVAGIQAIDPDMVALQIKTVCEGFNVSAAKTGMLYSAEIIKVVGESAIQFRLKKLVVDPVMISTSGARLLKKDAEKMLRLGLLPLALAVTPNIPEAEVLCGESIRTIDDAKGAARDIGQTYGISCVVKGGHLGGMVDGSCLMGNGKKRNGELVTDVLYEKGRVSSFSVPRVKVASTHGTGCMFSAAMAASIAKGASLKKAVEHAQGYVLGFLKKGVQP